MSKQNLTPSERTIRLYLRDKKWHPTNAICRDLEMSPATLKAFAWKLRKKGVAIESARGQGYRLVRDA